MDYQSVLPHTERLQTRAARIIVLEENYLSRDNLLSQALNQVGTHSGLLYYA
jgi:hypothetical protein